MANKSVRIVLLVVFVALWQAIVSTNFTYAANCNLSSTQLTSTSETSGDFATWEVSLVPGEEISPIYLSEIFFTGEFVSGKTQIYLNGWPLHYQLDTVELNPQYSNGFSSKIIIDYQSDAITLLPTQTYTVKVKDMRNRSEFQASGNFYDSAPNTPASLACNFSGVTLSAPTPTPTATVTPVPQLTATPVPPSQPLTPTQTLILPTKITLPTVAPITTTMNTVTVTLAAKEPVLQELPTKTSTGREIIPTTVSNSSAEMNGPSLVPSAQEVAPSPTTIIDPSLLDKINQAAQEKRLLRVQRTRVVKAVLLGEATSLIFLGALITVGKFFLKI